MSDPINSINTIADFIGVDTTTDPNLIQRVAEGCQFDNVKRAAMNSIENGIQGNISHLRKGKVGDWRTHFTKELYHQFELEIRSHSCDENSTTCLEYDIGEGQKWKLKI